MSDTRLALLQIAEILNVPIEMFFEPARFAGPERARVQECVELIQTFQRIQAREVRRRCLIFVQTEADQSAKQEAGLNNP